MLCDTAVCGSRLDTVSHQSAQDYVFFDRLSRLLYSAIFRVNSFGMPWQYRRFSGLENGDLFSGGNDHYVVYLANKNTLTSKELADWALLSKLTPFTVVLLFNLSDVSADVRFFQSGFSILRCGSGVLAATAVVHERIYADSFKGAFGEVFTSHSHVHVASLPYKLFSFKASESLWKTKRLESSVKYTNWPAGCYGFSLRTLAVRPVPLKCRAAWQALVNHPIQKAFYIGQQKDYVHLIFCSRQDLDSLSIRFSLMCLWQQRALIATAPSDDPSFDYCLRYFAPQYSKLEDAATGSAHLQVAAYWQARLRKRRVIGVQSLRGESYFECESIHGLGSDQMLSGYTCIDNV